MTNVRPSPGLFALLAILLLPAAAREPPIGNADILVVGAGLAGLSAALEAARDGAQVTVLDMASVFGGHAIMSEGDVNIVDTPLQRTQGIQDSADLAYQDIMAWGEDSNTDWAHFYASHSRHEIYDWLTAMGVKFEGLRHYPGNTVPRAHITQGRGLGLVTPVYRECLRNSRITFVWNFKVLDLIMQHGHVAGLQGKDLRTDRVRSYHARAVVLATGGFQSNLELVRRHWPRDLPMPARLLAGSGINSQGSGLELAGKAGAALFNLDHQWNYERGMPDPRYPGMERGLNAAVTSIQVNALGKTFMPPEATSKTILPIILRQPGGTYWRIFDENAKRTFWISGSDWGNFSTIERLILDNDAIVKKGASIEELAGKAGLPAAALKETIAQSNAGSLKIDTPPFYAVQFFPLARKSMGGIAIDKEARVIDRQGRAIRGLYAAGEAAGEAGINGKAPLEGTFLGPGVITGRMAARTAVSDFSITRSTDETRATDSRISSRTMADSSDSASCSGCHDLKTLIDKPRAGYWHFEHVHRTVLERQYECKQCHANLGAPFQSEQHKIDRVAQTEICRNCHLAK